jgi:hypothetical protein
MADAQLTNITTIQQLDQNPECKYGTSVHKGYDNNKTFQQDGRPEATALKQDITCLKVRSELQIGPGMQAPELA